MRKIGRRFFFFFLMSNRRVVTKEGSESLSRDNSESRSVSPSVTNHLRRAPLSPTQRRSQADVSQKKKKDLCAPTPEMVTFESAGRLSNSLCKPFTCTCKHLSNPPPRAGFYKLPALSARRRGVCEAAAMEVTKQSGRKRSKEEEEEEKNKIMKSENTVMNSAGKQEGRCCIHV